MDRILHMICSYFFSHPIRKDSFLLALWSQGLCKFGIATRFGFAPKICKGSLEKWTSLLALYSLDSFLFTLESQGLCKCVIATLVGFEGKISQGTLDKWTEHYVPYGRTEKPSPQGLLPPRSGEPRIVEVQQCSYASGLLHVKDLLRNERNTMQKRMFCKQLNSTTALTIVCVFTVLPGCVLLCGGWYRKNPHALHQHRNALCS